MELNFGDYIKNLRKSRKLTVRELEGISGVSQSYITNVENNKRGVPSPDILKKLAKALEVEYLELMSAAGYIEDDDNKKVSSTVAKEFGQYLRNLRGKNSLRFIERKSGVSHTYLSSLEKGQDPRTGKERVPTPEVLKKLSTTYGVSYEELMEKAGYIAGAIHENDDDAASVARDVTLSKYLKTPSYGELLEMSGSQEGFELGDQNKIQRTVIDELIRKKELNSGKGITSFTVRFAYADNKRLEHISEQVGVSKQEFIAKVTLAALMEAELKLGLAQHTEKGIEYNSEYIDHIKS